MCGRTSLFADARTIVDRFDAVFADAHRPRYNVAPRQPLATITARDPDTIVRQEWGLLSPWADDPDDGPRPINARAETVSEKSMFREPYRKCRCLVLADGFYEWAGSRGSTEPYRIHLTDDEPFSMAGLWNRWEPEEGTGKGDGERKGDRDPLETVTIVTCEATDRLATIHDRMPVILERETERSWLTAEPDDATALLEPYDGTDLGAYPIDTTINDPENDGPEILEPVQRDEQVDLGEFAGCSG